MKEDKGKGTKHVKQANQTNKKSGLGFPGKHLRTQPKAYVCRI